MGCDSNNPIPADKLAMQMAWCAYNNPPHPIQNSGSTISIVQEPFYGSESSAVQFTT